jgi:C4-dicarboxylate transporter DctQ subunit
MKSNPARLLDRIEEGAMALFLGFMTLITFLQVVLRYGFNTGLIWSLEATVYAFSWLVLIGMSYGVRTGGHIAANLLVTRFSGDTRKWLGLVATALCLIYAGLLLTGSISLLDKLMQLGHDARDLPMRRWALTIILPIGFGMLTLRLIQTLHQVFKGERLGPSIDEAVIADEMDLIDKDSK